MSFMKLHTCLYSMLCHLCPIHTQSGRLQRGDNRLKPQHSEDELRSNSFLTQQTGQLVNYMQMSSFMNDACLLKTACRLVVHLCKRWLAKVENKIAQQLREANVFHEAPHLLVLQAVPPLSSPHAVRAICK